ncbi:MAG: SAF domain-containing protein [Patescibacteria group bacterium]
MKLTTEKQNNKKLITNGLRAVGVFLSVSLLVTSIILYSQLKKNSNVELETVQVLIAAEDISALHNISSDDVVSQQFVKGFEPANAFTLEQFSDINGKKILLSVQKGDIISPSHFGVNKSGKSRGIANTLPPEQQAVFLSKEDVHIFPPDLYEGNFVDIVAINTDDSSQNKVEVLLQNVEVFEIVKSGGNSADNTDIVGFLVTPEQALTISEKLDGSWLFQINLRSQNTDRTATSSAPIIIEQPISTNEATTNEDEN